MGTEKEQSSYYTELEQLGAKAGDELRRIYDNYLQELQAAWAGDDSMQRATAAYRNFQREYGRIQTEYFQETGLRQERLLDSLNTLTSTSNAQALDSWIEFLRGLRQNLPQKDEPKVTSKKQTS
jgi:hypothetical protein